MKIFLPLLFLFVSNLSIVLSQTVSEKELFALKYKGITDAYNFKYDKASGNYCYVYRVPDENKSFIISKKSVSEKYDYVISEDIRFDSKGNYYVVTSDYKPDYGSDNNFLISNGKVIKSFGYIESYSSYVNKKNEFVFVFKENDLYRIGYYNPETGFRQSGEYENIRTAFSYNAGSYQMEGDAEAYKEEDFYHDENGGRAFIATKNGKAKIIFETTEVSTDYADINESSLTMNKNNELSYIAKKGGRFYELAGNEFVVSGKKEYDKFELANIPLFFNGDDEPVYTAGDSVSESKTNNFIVIGSQIQKAYLDENRSVKAPDFYNNVSGVRINTDGNISYIGATETIVPGKKTNPDDEVYDEYYTKSFFVNNGIAYELGYNVNKLIFNNEGQLLYSAIADIEKKEPLLILNYGLSRIIVNESKFDDIYEYGFTPSNEIYYVGQTDEDTILNKKAETSLYIGNRLIGRYDYITYQTLEDSTSILKFDSKNNYAFVGENKIDSVNTEDFIVTNSGRLPFPQNVSGSKMFTYIYNLMYTKDDNLFFTADMTVDPVTYDVTKELFVNNKTLEKKYNSIYDLSYDEAKNEISFLGSRENKIYYVTVRF